MVEEPLGAEPRRDGRRVQRRTLVGRTFLDRFLLLGREEKLFIGSVGPSGGQIIS